MQQKMGGEIFLKATISYKLYNITPKMSANSKYLCSGLGEYGFFIFYTSCFFKVFGPKSKQGHVFPWPGKLGLKILRHLVNFLEI